MWIQEKKTIYVSDSIGVRDDAGNVLETLKGKGYTTFTHDGLRQSDSYNCSMFCLMDVRKIDDPSFIRGVQESSAWYRNGISDIIPADLLVATQSINKLRHNQEIGEFLDNARNQGQDFNLVKNEFESKFVQPLRNKFDLDLSPSTYQKLKFVEAYEGNLEQLYKNNDLRKLYFFQKNSADSGKTPLESASFFEEAGINTYATVVRSMLLSRILQRSL